MKSVAFAILIAATMLETTLRDFGKEAKPLSEIEGAWSATLLAGFVLSLIFS